MTNREISKATACGIAMVFWPIFFIAEIVIAKRLFPNWFSHVGGGIAGIDAAAVYAQRERDWETFLGLRMFGLFAIAILAGVFLAWIIYSSEDRLRAASRARTKP